MTPRGRCVWNTDVYTTAKVHQSSEKEGLWETHGGGGEAAAAKEMAWGLLSRQPSSWKLKDG